MSVRLSVSAALTSYTTCWDTIRSLEMMNLTAPIRIDKNADKKAPAEPDYRIFAGDIERSAAAGSPRRNQAAGSIFRSRSLTRRSRRARSTRTLRR